MELNHLMELSGALPFRMTSDILFKIMMQEDTEVLKAIVCSYLDLDTEDIRDIVISNPISLNDDIQGKEMILDIRAMMNDDTIINLEMQVINYQDWPERSLSYLCRCFDNLQKGQGYLQVKGAVHIGFLDYTLFQQNPEFYSTYRLINERTGQLYSSKFRISVVDLTLIKLATEDDKKYHRDLWASFFKAKEWGELMELAKQDQNIQKAVVTLKKLTEDEKFKLQYEAREDRIRQELDMKYYYETKFAEMDKKHEEDSKYIAEQAKELAEQAKELAEQAKELAEQKKENLEQAKKLAEQDQRIVEQKQQIVEQNQHIAEQDQRIVEQNQQITTQTQQLLELKQCMEQLQTQFKELQQRKK